ncbi:MAG TPA: hypothetical protein VN039_03800, partial [Nitrospira sp.]|nr:hypothetical protein [Nitrospira sp.]
MKDRPVHSNLASTAAAGKEGSIEPLAEFPATIEVFDLFVLFKVVTDNEARALPFPLHPAHLLTRTLRDETTLVVVLKSNNDVCLGVGRKEGDSKLPLYV